MKHRRWLAIVQMVVILLLSLGLAVAAVFCFKVTGKAQTVSFMYALGFCCTAGWAIVFFTACMVFNHGGK